MVPSMLDLEGFVFSSLAIQELFSAGKVLAVSQFLLMSINGIAGWLVPLVGIRKYPRTNSAHTARTCTEPFSSIRLVSPTSTPQAASTLSHPPARTPIRILVWLPWAGVVQGSATSRPCPILK